MNWFNTSLMLNVDEYISLVNMIKLTNDTLLYRATTHGFEASAFHAKCDGKENTITIIKTNGNYVFGGYTAAKWTSEDAYYKDSKAFIFSLRRTGISCHHKFMVKDAKYAINASWRYGPIFGKSFLIRDKSDQNRGSVTVLGENYDYSHEIEDAKTFLAGSYDQMPLLVALLYRPTIHGFEALVHMLVLYFV